ncbi:MAG: glycosyltransferase family 1 protein [Pseudomonadota bacterium]
MTIRVGFPMVGGAAWTGGLNYLINLLAALREYAPEAIEPVLFVEHEAQLPELAPLREWVTLPPVVVTASAGPSRRWRKTFDCLVRQRDVGLENALRGAGVSLVFQHSAWFGLRFGLPTLAWIPDFQHRHLPQMFKRTTWLKRDLGYRGITHSATRLMLSSEDARRDVEQFYPAARGKSRVVSFAVKTDDCADAEAHNALLLRHAIPQKFFYLPNQFWKHKNHRLVIEALALLRTRGVRVNIISSGNMQDARDPAFPASIVQEVRERGLDEQFQFLGMVPRSDIPLLMQAAVAVINPSLFEGWSTVVEEAKSLGVALVLSDLAVHREQAPARARFFDPHDATTLVDALAAEWQNEQGSPGDAALRYQSAKITNEMARAVFARRFAALCAETIHATADGT